MDEIGIYYIFATSTGGKPRIASIKHYATCRGSARYDSLSFANVENERVIRRTVEQALSLEVVK